MKNVFIMKQFQFSIKQILSFFSLSQFNVDSIQFNNRVDAAKFMNYEQTEFSYKAETNSVIQFDSV